MKKQRHTKEQISFVLKQVELGAPVSEVCRKVGITEQMFYRWKNKYGGNTLCFCRNTYQCSEHSQKCHSF